MTTGFILEATRNGQISGIYTFAFSTYGSRDKALSAASEMSEAIYEEGDDVTWFEV